LRTLERTAAETKLYSTERVSVAANDKLNTSPFSSTSSTNDTDLATPITTAGTSSELVASFVSDGPLRTMERTSGRPIGATSGSYKNFSSNPLVTHDIIDHTSPGNITSVSHSRPLTTADISPSQGM